MVAGLAFLSKKGFNPKNQSNQKQVWEAQRSKEQEDRKIKERQEQLKREHEDEELTKARGEIPHLKWVYEPPPGMEAAGTTQTQPSPDKAPSSSINNNSSNSSDPHDRKMPATATATTTTATATAATSTTTNPHDVTQIQPGDDPAAAAFRRMLAGELEDNEEANSNGGNDPTVTYGTVFQGTSIEKDNSNKGGKGELSALEKAVGRKDGNAAMTLEEQVARFPQLKNAPMAKGMNSTDVGVSFKPLGGQLRNVRCLACGVWGHSKGERECQVSGWDPFSAAKRPMANYNNNNASGISRTGQEKSVQQSTKKTSSKVGDDDDDDDDDNDNSSQSDSSSSSEDSYRERKRRKKSSRKGHKKKESKKSRRSRSESPSDRRKRSRRSRSESPDDREERSRSRKKSKKSRKRSRENK